MKEIIILQNNNVISIVINEFSFQTRHTFVVYNVQQSYDQIKIGELRLKIKNYKNLF